MENKEDQLRKLDRKGKILTGYVIAVLLVLVAINLIALFNIIQLGSDNKQNIIEQGKSNKAFQTQLKDAAGKNRARADVGLCIFSVSPTRRTPEYVKGCYDQIEKQYGFKIQRFGDGV